MEAEPTGNDDFKVKSDSQQPPSQAGKRKAEAEAEAEGGSDDKRRKFSPEPERFMKDPRFWFPDGNIQVQVGTMQFNLYRGRLAASSHWFKDHFASGGAYEGVVNLDDAGVDATDFQWLLVAMDDIVDFHQSPPPFVTLASMYRAASILDFPKFRSYARGALEALFPDSMKDVRAKTTPHAAEVIILAREWGLPRVLKRAFYELARSPPTTATATALNLLSPADITLVAQAREHLAAEWLSVYAPPQCEVCAKSAVTKHSDISWFMSLSVKYQFDPILGLATLPQDYAKQNHFCGICTKVREKGWRAHALKIWKTDLNVWFSLA